MSKFQEVEKLFTRNELVLGVVIMGTLSGFLIFVNLIWFF
jgi:hypothetical protein